MRFSGLGLGRSDGWSADDSDRWRFVRVSVRPDDGPGAREGVFGHLAVLVKNANFAIFGILVILGQFGVWGSFWPRVRFWSKSDILGSGLGQKVVFGVLAYLWSLPRLKCYFWSFLVIFGFFWPGAEPVRRLVSRQLWSVAFCARFGQARRRPRCS